MIGAPHRIQSQGAFCGRLSGLAWRATATGLREGTRYEVRERHRHQVLAAQVSSGAAVDLALERDPDRSGLERRVGEQLRVPGQREVDERLFVDVWLFVGERYISRRASIT